MYLFISLTNIIPRYLFKINMANLPISHLPWRKFLSVKLISAYLA